LLNVKTEMSMVIQELQAATDEIERLQTKTANVASTMEREQNAYHVEIRRIQGIIDDDKLAFAGAAAGGAGGGAGMSSPTSGVSDTRDTRSGMFNDVEGTQHSPDSGGNAGGKVAGRGESLEKGAGESTPPQLPPQAANGDLTEFDQPLVNATAVHLRALFDGLKAETGVTDIGVMLQRFTTLDRKNFSLFNYIHNLGAENDVLQAQIDGFKSDIERFNDDGRGGEDRRQNVQDAIKQQYDALQAHCHTVDGKVKSLESEFHSLRSGVVDLFKGSGCHETDDGKYFLRQIVVLPTKRTDEAKAAAAAAAAGAASSPADNTAAAEIEEMLAGMDGVGKKSGHGDDPVVKDRHTMVHLFEQVAPGESKVAVDVAAADGNTGGEREGNETSESVGGTTKERETKMGEAKGDSFVDRKAEELLRSGGGSGVGGEAEDTPSSGLVPALTVSTVTDADANNLPRETTSSPPMLSKDEGRSQVSPGRGRARRHTAASSPSPTRVSPRIARVKSHSRSPTKERVKGNDSGRGGASLAITTGENATSDGATTSISPGGALRSPARRGRAGSEVKRSGSVSPRTHKSGTVLEASHITEGNILQLLGMIEQRTA
jgi:hypothetical protein